MQSEKVLRQNIGMAVEDRQPLGDVTDWERMSSEMALIVDNTI